MRNQDREALLAALEPQERELRQVAGRLACKGTTRDGRPCAAPAVILSETGYCHWHDPDRALDRIIWCAGRRRPRSATWTAKLIADYGQAESGRGEEFSCFHPENASAARPATTPPTPGELATLLAALPAGQRRVAQAVLAEPAGRTYPAAAAVLGIHLGTLHRHLGRIRQGQPEVYRAIMAQRRVQQAQRHDQTVARERARGAARRAQYLQQHGCEPWAALRELPRTANLSRNDLGN